MVLVTLPEDMPAHETIELHAAVTEELGFPVGAVIVNSYLSPLFSDAERSVVEDLPFEIPADSPLHPTLRAGRARSLRERVQHESTLLLTRNLPGPFHALPHLFVERFNRAALEHLASTFE